MTSEAGRDELPHASFGAAVGIYTDGPLGFMAQTGGVYQTATAFSEYWYRYRGYFGLNTAIGIRYEFGPIALHLSGGGILAHYDLSYSWFWFPYLETGAEIPVLALGSKVRMACGISIPVYFRADAQTVGIMVTARFLLLPQQNNGGVEGAAR